MAGCRRGVVALLFLVVCLSHAHEGHDHGEEVCFILPTPGRLGKQGLRWRQTVAAYEGSWKRSLRSSSR